MKYAYNRPGTNRHHEQHFIKNALFDLGVIGLGLFPIFGYATAGVSAQAVTVLSPISSQRYVAYVTPTTTPTPTPVDTGEDDFIRRVHILESSAGRNSNPDALHNRCKGRGESNEYGYGGMANQWCYTSPQAAEKRVREWYRQYVAELGEENVYCYYNLGLKTNDCDYYRKAIQL
jgi:hypothetical protein